MVWTIVTFLLVLLVLTKTAWKPILDALNKREKKIKDDLERAENSQKEAEALRQKYETQLAGAQKSVLDMINQASVEGEKTRSKILEEAKKESGRILEKGRQELAGEAERLKQELRKDVAELSVDIAEKILGKAVDQKLQEEVVKSSLIQIGGMKK